jgi:hypothetical protein
MQRISVSPCAFNSSTKEKRMKKSFAACLIAVPLLALSSIVSAAELDVQSPMLLNADQMDGVTAGRYFFNPDSWQSFFTMFKHAQITQINASPVTIVQIGNNNTAIVYSGNFATITQ